MSSLPNEKRGQVLILATGGSPSENRKQVATGLFEQFWVYRRTCGRSCIFKIEFFTKRKPCVQERRITCCFTKRNIHLRFVLFLFFWFEVFQRFALGFSLVAAAMRNLRFLCVCLFSRRQPPSWRTFWKVRIEFSIAHVVLCYVCFTDLNWRKMSSRSVADTISSSQFEVNCILFNHSLLSLNSCFESRHPAVVLPINILHNSTSVICCLFRLTGTFVLWILTLFLLRKQIFNKLLGPLETLDATAFWAANQRNVPMASPAPGYQQGSPARSDYESDYSCGNSSPGKWTFHFLSLACFVACL